MLSGLWTLCITLVGAFFGSYFAHALGLLTQSRTERRATYEEALNILTEYSQRLSAVDQASQSPIAIKPIFGVDEQSRQFLIRVDRVDIHIADEFSKNAYQSWRNAHYFFTSDGSLPPKKQKYDFETAREEALGALHNELLSKWRMPRSRGREMREELRK